MNKLLVVSLVDVLQKKGDQSTLNFVSFTLYYCNSTYMWSVMRNDAFFQHQHYYLQVQKFPPGPQNSEV